MPEKPLPFYRKEYIACLARDIYLIQLKISSSADIKNSITLATQVAWELDKAGFGGGIVGSEPGSSWLSHGNNIEDIEELEIWLRSPSEWLVFMEDYAQSQRENVLGDIKARQADENELRGLADS